MLLVAGLRPHSNSCHSVGRAGCCGGSGKLPSAHPQGLASAYKRAFRHTLLTCAWTRSSCGTPAALGGTCSEYQRAEIIY